MICCYFILWYKIMITTNYKIFILFWFYFNRKSNPRPPHIQFYRMAWLFQQKFIIFAGSARKKYLRGLRKISFPILKNMVFWQIPRTGNLVCVCPPSKTRSQFWTSICRFKKAMFGFSEAGLFWIAVFCLILLRFDSFATVFFCYSSTKL